MIIYKFTNIIDGKEYVGQTTTSFEKRIKTHYGAKDNIHFHKALREHGKENFIVEEICCAKNINDLNYLEQFFIQHYNTLAPHGYNIALGGNNFKRVRGAMQGKTHSEETKMKMSLAAIGKPKSPEAVRKMSLTKKGKKLSLNHCQKIGDAQRGKKKSGRRIISLNFEKEFISVTEASKCLSIPRRTLSRWLSLNKNKQIISYKERE